MGRKKKKPKKVYELNVQSLLIEFQAIQPELRQSIVEEGLQVPPLVVSAGGKFRVLQGQKRLNVVQSLGWNRVPCYRLKQSLEADFKLACGVDDRHFERAQAYLTLKENFDCTQSQLAAMLGKTRDEIVVGMAPLNITPPAKKKLVEQRLSLRHLRYVARLPNHEQVKLAEAIINNKSSTYSLEHSLLPKVYSKAKFKPRSLDEAAQQRNPSQRRRYLRSLQTTLQRLKAKEQQELERIRERILHYQNTANLLKLAVREQELALNKEIRRTKRSLSK